MIDAVFDEANLVSCAGLAPVLALAEQAGLSQLLAERVTVASPNAALKVTALVAGMVAGADSIDDMDLLRHGAMDRLFTGVRAPSTLGTFLVRHEALLFRMGVRDHPSPRRRSGEVKLEAA